MTDIENNSAAVQVRNEASTLEAFATSYPIATAQQYENGAADLARVKGMQKKLEDTRTSITGPMNLALKKVNDFFRAPADLLERAERTIKGSLGSYTEAQEQLRLEEQRKADEIARKERERIEERARKAAESGKLEKSEALAAQAATVVAPVIQREVPKVAGLQMREVWEYVIVDASKINAAFMMPDEKKIGAQVRALKGDAAAIIGPGVRVTKRMAPASSAA